VSLEMPALRPTYRGLGAAQLFTKMAPQRRSPGVRPGESASGAATGPEDRWDSLELGRQVRELADELAAVFAAVATLIRYSYSARSR
jgi:hypothetical protein